MSTPMECPGCGSTMNHHADKVMFTDRGEELDEFYQCPDCGDAASRVAERQVVEG